MYQSNNSSQKKTASCLSVCSASALLIGLLSFSASMQANEDTENVITVEADSAQINAKTGTILYQGNVIIQHPQVTIIGESVELIDDGNKRHFISSGSPSQISWQHVEGKSIGSAAIITFKEDLTQRLLSMKGNASVFHQGNQVQGHWIFYNFISEQLNVSSKSPDDGAETTQQQSTQPKRIKIILKQKQ